MSAEDSGTSSFQKRQQAEILELSLRIKGHRKATDNFKQTNNGEVLGMKMRQLGEKKDS